MDVVQPPLCTGLHHRVPEQAGQRFVPDDVPVDDAPVPDRVVGGLCGQPIAFLDVEALGLGRLAIGDVQRGADQADHFAVAIAQWRLGRQPPRAAAIWKADFLFHLLAAAAGHYPLVGGHDCRSLGGVGQQFGIGAPDILRRGAPDQCRCAAVAHQQAALAILGIHHARRGLNEGAQQGLGLVTLGLHPQPFVDVDEDAGEAQCPTVLVQVDAADTFQPMVTAVGAARAVLMREAAAMPHGMLDGRRQPCQVIGVHRAQHLVQLQLALGQRRVEPERAGERFVNGQLIVRHIPEPGADDGTRCQRHVHAVGGMGGLRLGNGRLGHGRSRTAGRCPPRAGAGRTWAASLDQGRVTAAWCRVNRHRASPASPVCGTRRRCHRARAVPAYR